MNNNDLLPDYFAWREQIREQILEYKKRMSPGTYYWFCNELMDFLADEKGESIMLTSTESQPLITYPRTSTW